MAAISITMRTSTAADEPLLFTLFAENKAAEFASLTLAPGAGSQLSSLLQMQFRARCLGYRQTFPDAVQYIVLDAAGQAVGHVLLHEEETSVRIVDLAIAGAFRGRGLGAAVLQVIQARAARQGRLVCLQAAAGSQARPLYERLGFGAVLQSPLACEMSWSAAEPVEARTACAV